MFILVVMESFYVVGDIEDNDEAFNDAIECIRLRHDKRIVFLGDIYTSTDRSKSIAHIAEILWRLQIPIENFVDVTFDPSNHTTEEIRDFCYKIKLQFDKLYEAQYMSLYTNSNKLKSCDKLKELAARDTAYRNDKVIFILGNKECNLITDMHEISSLNILDGKFSGRYTYSFHQEIHRCEIAFTLPEINILLTYLSKAVHFHILNETLFMHIYASARYLMKTLKLPHIKRIVAGHNRCFGRYVDPANAKIGIYMMDKSHENPNTVKNYALVQGDNIIYYSANNICRKILNNVVFSAKKTFLCNCLHATTIDFYDNYKKDRDNQNEEHIYTNNNGE